MYIFLLIRQYRWGASLSRKKNAVKQLVITSRTNKLKTRINDKERLLCTSNSQVVLLQNKAMKSKGNIKNSLLLANALDTQVEVQKEYKFLSNSIQTSGQTSRRYRISSDFCNGTTIDTSESTRRNHRRSTRKSICSKSQQSYDKLDTNSEEHIYRDIVEDCTDSPFDINEYKQEQIQIHMKLSIDQKKKSTALFHLYKKSSIYSSLELEEFESDSFLHNNHTKSNDTFQWMFEVKRFNITDIFSQQYLIIIRHHDKNIMLKSWDELNNIRSATKAFDEVIAIPRSNIGQLYIVQGLQDSPHFSISMKSYQEYLVPLCLEHNIPCYKINNTIKNNTNVKGLYVRTYNEFAISRIDNECQIQMRILALKFLPIMFNMNLSTDSSQRATYVINLGITNRRLDKIRRVTVTGRAGLNLISTSTNKIHIPDNSLECLGKFLLFVIEKVIPTTAYKDLFKTSNPYEKEYLQMFANQLKIGSKDKLDLFSIPAVSILINKDLNPHCDSMNPVDRDLDYTMAMSIVINAEELPEPLRKLIPVNFKSQIPLCVVMYRRKALIYYANRMTKMDNYMIDEQSHSMWKRKLVMLLKSVGSAADYVGCFFFKTNNRTTK